MAAGLTALGKAAGTSHKGAWRGRSHTSISSKVYFCLYTPSKQMWLKAAAWGVCKCLRGAGGWQGGCGWVGMGAGGAGVSFDGLRQLPQLVTFRQRATALLKDGPPLAIKFRARIDLSVTLCFPGSTATALAKASMPLAKPISIRLADWLAMWARNSTAGWQTYSQREY
ncbi:MAG: hypothetical protein FRX49_08871 [Trebouxia sp. A1-2]|nr:MAG: hypothetical protein FRX49_08871 [Trebouxia sp. A1-2]